jgi:hypothetical protein
MLGDDYDLLYKRRKSIVILYLPGHYELVGVRYKNGVEKTLFSPDDPFIKVLRRRMEKLCAGSFVMVDKDKDSERDR